MTVGGATRLIFEKQLLHLVLLLALLLGLFLLGSLDGFLDGSLWSIDTEIWLVLAVASAIVHQVYVWFCWRTQLHLSLLTRMMGPNQNLSVLPHRPSQEQLLFGGQHYGEEAKYLFH